MVLSVGVVAAVFVAIAAGAYWWQQSQKSLAAKSVSAPETASETSPPPARVPATRAGSSNEFAVASFEIERTKGNSLVYVVGTVRNESARQRFGVKVEFDLLDGSGAKVGTTKDYAAVIEPRGAWRFKALVLDPKPVASARLAAIREEQ